MVTRQSNGLVRTLLRLPLFYKLVLANGAITLAAVVGCTSVVAAAVRRNPHVATTDFILGFVVVAVIVGIIVNAVLVRLALTPVRALESAASEVHGGNLGARAAQSALSDASTEHVVRTFNEMLDSLVEYRTRLREIAVRALDAAENERLRLSNELHDNLAQSLAALLVQLRVARAARNGSQDKLLAGVAEQLIAIIEEVRSMATELRPPALDMLGLGAAVSAHARTLTESTGVQIDVQLDRVDGALTPEAELALYRLVQEALANVIRHGEVSEAELAIKRVNGDVTAVISDHGKGFEVKTALADRSLGLIGMRERAAYVGGTVNFESAPGRGTTVRIEMPAKGVSKE
jgi:two-component system, NarL family, sensor histidine kinase UhpB